MESFLGRLILQAQLVSLIMKEQEAFEAMSSIHHRWMDWHYYECYVACSLFICLFDLAVYVD